MPRTAELGVGFCPRGLMGRPWTRLPKDPKMQKQTGEMDYAERKEESTVT